MNRLPPQDPGSLPEGAEVSSGSVLRHLRRRSHPPARGEGTGPAAPSVRSSGGACWHPVLLGKPALDLARVEEEAAKGLTLGEILGEVGWEGELPASLKVQAEAAIKRGRAHGSAELKKAQYKSAIKGRVTSLTQMLSLLSPAPEQEEEGTEFTVERVIIGGEDQAD